MQRQRVPETKDDGDAEGFLPAAGAPGRWLVLAVVAIGGAAGALARHGVDLLLPTTPGTFPWSTFTVNAAGCLLLGLLAGLLYRPDRHRLLVPFVVTGLLGGFTTFSTYTVQTIDLGLRSGAGASLAYLLATPVSALVAVEVGFTVVRWRRRDRPGVPIRW